MRIVHIEAPANVPRERLSPAGTPPNPEGGEAARLSKQEAFAAPDGRMKTGIWEATPGRFRRAVMDAEFSHFIAGHATFVADDGQIFEFREGDAAFFPPGTQGTWTIHDTLRKTYVIWQAISLEHAH
jgi:uncharacterized cupin superfamily protein